MDSSAEDKPVGPDLTTTPTVDMPLHAEIQHDTIANTLEDCKTDAQGSSSLLSPPDSECASEHSQTTANHFPDPGEAQELRAELHQDSEKSSRKRTAEEAEEHTAKKHRLSDIRLSDACDIAETRDSSVERKGPSQLADKNQTSHELFGESQELLPSVDLEAQLREACGAFVPSGAMVLHKAADLEESEARLKNMEVPLRLYQLLGAAYIRKRDSGDTLPIGGILADQMGYGKTIQMIANIVNGLEDATSDSRPTLIVVPSALTKQWFQEFKKCAHKNIASKVMILNTDSILHTAQPEEYIKIHQVVITTYAQVRKSYDYMTRLEMIKLGVYNETTEHEDEEDALRATLLHTFEFHRVVLDECQNMKNWKCATAKACTAINATRRWLISGTPLQDQCYDEIFSYFKFLRFPDIKNRGSFQLKYLPGDRLDESQVRKALYGVMIRRTDQSIINGRPILHIPEPQVTETIILHLRKQEAELYRLLERYVNRSLKDISATAEDEEEAHDRKLMVITLLRQMRSYPLLIAHLIWKIAPNEALLKSYFRVSCLRSPTDIQLESMIKYFCNLATDYENHQPKVRALNARIDKAKKSLLNFATSSKSIKAKKLRENIARLMKDRNKLRNSQPRFNIGKWLNASGKRLLTSTLIERVYQEYLKRQQEEPGCKVLIYTHFLVLIKVLLITFKRQRKNLALPFHGSVAQKTRQKNLARFLDTGSETNILICTPQIGGVGLNLTVASKIFILDLWWNRAMEEQIAGRINRFGQVKATEVIRFKVQNTVDERILQIQQEKTARIKSIMNRDSETDEKCIELFLEKFTADALEETEMDIADGSGIKDGVESMFDNEEAPLSNEDEGESNDDNVDNQDLYDEVLTDDSSDDKDDGSEYMGDDSVD